MCTEFLHPLGVLVAVANENLIAHPDFLCRFGGHRSHSFTRAASGRFTRHKNYACDVAFRPAEAADESELYRIVGHCERDRAWYRGCPMPLHEALHASHHEMTPRAVLERFGE